MDNFFTKNKKLYKFISSAVPQIHPVSPDELYTKHMKRSSTSSIQVIAPLETESTIHWTVYRKTYLSFYNSRYKICSFIWNIFEGFMQFAFFFFGPLHFYIDKYIHVQLNFNVFTIDISNIIDVLKWVKTTVRLYIYMYLQLLLPLDISKIYVSFGRLPLVPENKILLSLSDICLCTRYSSFIYHIPIYIICLKVLNYRYIQVFWGFTYLSLSTSTN